MLVGLDAIPLTETRTGIGHYTFELARSLAIYSPADEFELAYPSIYPPVRLVGPDEPPPPPNLHPARVEAGVFGRHWWSIGLSRYVRRRRLELFHGTNYDVPLWSGCPVVNTIHDLSLLFYPSTHESRSVRRGRLRLPVMARRATMIITPTESVKREVCERFLLSPAKVVAVPEAPRSIFEPLAAEAAREARGRLLVEDEFLLAVCTLEPRKNLITLVRAFEDILRTHPAAARLQLVLAGASGWRNEEFHARVAASPARERIRLTGYLPDAGLRALYSSCVAFVYPSLYEGFGLPPLEAMACGAPVIASRIPALTETLGTEAARLFPPDDWQALARHIAELLDNAEARAGLAQAGREHASGFTWERTARLTREVYDEAGRRAGRGDEDAMAAARK